MTPRFQQIIATVALVIALQLIGGLIYHKTVIKRAIGGAVVFAVVDVQSVYREREIAFDKQLAGATTKETREAAILQVQQFALAVPTHLAALSVECKCMVLLSNAVGSSVGVPAGAGAGAGVGATNVVDLTPQLRKKLGLG